MSLNDADILRSAQKSLLFNVSPNMRYIFIEVGKDGLLKVLAYFRQQSQEAEIDMLNEFAGEIDGDFVELTTSEIQVVVSDHNTSDSLPSDSPIVTKVCEGLAAFYGSKVEL